jgi:hypothetical protein
MAILEQDQTQTSSRDNLVLVAASCEQCFAHVHSNGVPWRAGQFELLTRGWHRARPSGTLYANKSGLCASARMDDQNVDVL